MIDRFISKWKYRKYAPCYTIPTKKKTRIILKNYIKHEKNYQMWMFF